MDSKQPDQEQPPLRIDDSFRFACHDNLPCFTQCCRDVNIYLTPFDVLRLRRALGIGSAEVLARYTRHVMAGPSNVPLVQLLMNPETLRCELVTDAGCAVYDNRPWACRMYPLDVGSNEGEYLPFVGKDRCMGLREPVETTVGDWLAGQGLEPYAEMDRAFQDVIPDRFQRGEVVNAELGKILFLAYDLDRFSELFEDEQFRERYDIDDAMLRRLREDDELLLLLALRYIRNQLEQLAGFA